MTSFLDYRKRINSPEQIDEKLLPKEEDDARRMMGSGHSYYRESFLNHNPKAKDAFQKNPDTKQWSTRIPVTMPEDAAKGPHEGVTNFLRSHNYEASRENYKAGVATKNSMVGDPSKGIPMQEKTTTHKIGGLLEKHGATDEIKKNYTNDTFRSGAKTKDYDIVLTGHPHDVYGGSTGRGWTSCANKRPGDDKFNGKGPAAQKMSEEINNHTHHAYLVPRGGNVDTDAIGRMSFKHHESVSSGHKTLLPEDRVYGSPPDAFSSVAKHEVSKLFDRKPGEVYKKNSEVYNDNGKAFDFPKEGMKAEHVDAAWKSLGKKDENAKHQLYQKIDPEQKYKSTELNSVAKHIRNIGDVAKTGDFTKVANEVSHASTQINEHGHYHLVGQNEHMDAAIDAGAKTFNINNPEHVEALKSHGRRGNHIRAVFASRTAHNIPAAKTTDDYHAISALKDSGISVGPDMHRTPIDPKHKMGKNPHDAIVKSLADRGELNPKSYAHSYLSTVGHRKTTGNMYDHMVAHENDGVPGMSKVVDDAAQNMSHGNATNSFRGHTHMDNQALSYHLMKPQTRARIADALGEDHVKIMRNNRAAINDHKDLMDRIAAKHQKNQLEGNGE
jgi:hypothetical protein